MEALAFLEDIFFQVAIKLNNYGLYGKKMNGGLPDHLFYFFLFLFWCIP